MKTKRMRKAYYIFQALLVVFGSVAGGAFAFLAETENILYGWAAGGSVFAAMFCAACADELQARVEYREMLREAANK